MIRKTVKPPKAGTRKPAAPTPRAKRSRGRPRATQPAVGRDTIIAAARQLLDKLPPHQVTIVSIARKAGVDPALVRYYFANRAELLMAVVEDIIGSSWAAHHPPPDARPAVRMATHLSDLLAFSRRVRAMQRLMIDECAEAKSAEVRRRVKELNAHAVRFYAQMLHLDPEAAERSPDPLFMFVASIGLCEFFAAAQPMILPLAPKGMSPETLARKYEKFIIDLVLDGVRSRLDPRPGR